MRWFRKRESWQLSEILDRSGLRIGTQLLRQGFKHNRSDYPDLVYFTLALKESKGMTDGEWSSSEAIENSLEQWEDELGFVVVGVMTIAGKRDQIIYAKNGQALMNELHLRLGSYSPQMECQPDPRWSQYKDLFKLL